MVTLKGLGLVGLPLAAGFAAWILPLITILGIRREVLPVNNGKCVAVKGESRIFVSFCWKSEADPDVECCSGLVGCEDAWIDYEKAEAWLLVELFFLNGFVVKLTFDRQARVCSSHEARKSWLPATLHLDSASLPQVSTDYIAVLNLDDNSYKKVKLLGLPSDADGIYVHAIDAVKGPDGKKTVFINSHRPPKNRSLGKTLGANSVIEIFETTANPYELKHVKTVSHPLIRTPNNLVATGPRTFYASNDHRYKVHWVSFQVFRWKIQKGEG